MLLLQHQIRICITVTPIARAPKASRCKFPTPGLAQWSSSLEVKTFRMPCKTRAMQLTKLTTHRFKIMVKILILWTWWIWSRVMIPVRTNINKMRLLKTSLMPAQVCWVRKLTKGICKISPRVIKRTSSSKTNSVSNTLAPITVSRLQSSSKQRAASPLRRTDCRLNQPSISNRANSRLEC